MATPVIDDVADAAPGVEAVVQQPELRRARLEGEKAEGGVRSGIVSGGSQPAMVSVILPA